MWFIETSSRHSNSLLALALLGSLLVFFGGCAQPVEEPTDEAPAGATADETGTETSIEITAATPVVVAGELEIADLTANLMPEMGAVYLKVHNTGTEADRLLTVTSPIATAGELHESIEEEGLMKMVPAPDGFEVPAGGDLELAPGGKHVMLIGARAEAGASSIPVVLSFERAGNVEVTVPVGLGAGGGMDHDEMDHDGMDHGEMDHDEMDHGEMDHDEMGHEG